MGQISNRTIVCNDRVDIYDNGFAGLAAQVASNFRKGANGNAFVVLFF